MQIVRNECKSNLSYTTSTQYSLIVIIEKWRKNMDKGKSCAALLTDLSKAFDWIVHNFLTAKLEAYGCSYEALKVLHNYLNT